MQILIVDDHAFQRRALTSVITQIGAHKITQASDGDEAMRIMLSTTPDIIICDLIMPKMDGLALLRRLSEQQYKGSIIISSASNASILRAAANLVGALGLNLLAVIAKPFSKIQLSHFFKQHQSHYIKVKTKDPLHRIDTTKASLLHAINKGEFISVFQPQIDFNSGQCVGLEVLSRWDHPESGLLSPDFFIEQIEQAGLMTTLTFAMIEQSIQALKTLPRAFDQTKLSINLTPSFLTNDAVNIILANQSLLALAHRQRVTFEITEQTKILSESISLELLSRLRINGFNLSIDDFGTGYSSLKQLSQYPFNEIKIDRSFVADALIDIQSAAIVDMSIQLAKKLQMSVVVEGVETHEQWVYMKRLGAHTCQGFYCAKPIKYQQLDSWYVLWQTQYQAIQAKIKQAL